LMNLSILKNKPKNAEITLQLPCRPTVFHGGLVTGQQLKVTAPTTRYFDEETNSYRFGLSISETAEIEAMILYYKLPAFKSLPLSEMVEVLPAQPRDLNDIALIDRAVGRDRKRQNSRSPQPRDNGFFIARIADRVVGFLESFTENGNGSDNRQLILSFVGVVGAFRGFGIGRKMILSALKRASSEGIQEVRLSAPHEYRSFYVNLGFSPNSLTADSAGESLMLKKLSP
jgi:GNAT superfamily N-acetyltransferase